MPVASRPRPREGLLTVRATRAWVRAEGDQIQLVERANGEFSRQLLLGEGLGP